MVDSDKEIDNFLDENYEKNKDILVTMGFDLDLIKRVYIYLEPSDTDEAIHFMTEDHNKYNHPFLKNKKKKNLCLVCKKERNFHHKFNQNGEMIDMEESDIIYLNKHKNDNINNYDNNNFDDNNNNYINNNNYNNNNFDDNNNNNYNNNNENNNNFNNEINEENNNNKNNKNNFMNNNNDIENINNK